jgi:hypothetical protein
LIQEVYRKQRNAHNRLRKAVILVVTSNTRLRQDEVFATLNCTSNKTSIRILKTTKTGGERLSVIKRYAKEHGIQKKQGDKIYLYDEGRWLN